MPARARPASRRDAMDRGVPAQLGASSRQVQGVCRNEKGTSLLSYDLAFARVIDAGVEDVFDAFTDPEGQEEFYGQDDRGWIVESECDLRVGGVWSVAFGPSRGELYHHRHVFQVIDRPTRLVLSSTETWPDGSSFDTELEFRFEDQDGATLMTMLHKGFPTAEMRDLHRVGLPNSFHRLERVVLAGLSGANGDEERSS
jgi:uncharacterized protein YndB with AHSA1/START domain